MEQTQQASLKAKVQKLGSTLSSMVMPNIGALIAWGVLTALFIPDGYLPNESFASMVGPMLTYLIPLLVGYTGGKVIAGERGAVVGAIATMGVRDRDPDDHGRHDHGTVGRFHDQEI